MGLRAVQRMTPSLHISGRIVPLIPVWAQGTRELNFRHEWYRDVNWASGAALSTTEYGTYEASLGAVPGGGLGHKYSH